MAENTTSDSEKTDKFWRIEDIMSFMGLKKTCVYNLIATGKIPYIPSKPKLFFPEEVKDALKNMQVGGKYGKKRRLAA